MTDETLEILIHWNREVKREYRMIRKDDKDRFDGTERDGKTIKNEGKPVHNHRIDGQTTEKRSKNGGI